MELITCTIPKSNKELVIAPIGDIQWSGPKGATAEDHLRRHIDDCMEKGAWFVGLGDYIDFLSPSNRAKLVSAGLYDTARQVIMEKADELNHEVFEKFLQPTRGRWLGMVEGHHFYEGDGQTTDQSLAGMLGTRFLGTSAFIRIQPLGLVLYVHHGIGGGKLPNLNNLYHVAAGLPGADIYLMGHSTKLITTRLSRPFPIWTPVPELRHKDVWLVNCGSFSKSNVVGSRSGSIPRGDYAEQGLMTPSPLAAPIIVIENGGVRVSI